MDLAGDVAGIAASLDHLAGLDGGTIVAILEIIGINILLSGDNAVVIALACRSLPARKRAMGITLGVLAAIILRVIFTIGLQSLLGWPWITLVGGVLLLAIAIQLAVEAEHDNKTIADSATLAGAVWTIAIADMVMSLDNVLAIAGAAHGKPWLIFFGLAMSIPLIVWGATLILGLMTRFPILIWAGAALLGWVGRWYRDWLATHARAGARKAATIATGLTERQVIASIGILVVLMFSKFVYMTSLSSYYTFYLIEHFGTSVQTAQYCLFLLLASVAAGTMLGGPIGDRIGARQVILLSILGVLPFTLLLPYVNFTWTVLLTIPIGAILASAFSVMVVYAQSLVPGRVGLIGGLFFGLAFGSSGVAAAGLGLLADRVGIEPVYQICAFLPAIGLLALALPRMGGRTG